jgi:wyosine [tRNA(Phe)-imidazoG37] synthetase (radical SAM superfamily)
MSRRSEEHPSERSVSSIYGPVHSWRFGASLGVDLLLVSSICSFRCVYCQLGEIAEQTTERRVWVPTAQLEADLRRSGWRTTDVVTFSGNGEPTLAANLGEAISLVKKLTKKEVVVLTNATLLDRPEVRRDLAAADHVACKIDAPDGELARRINRPNLDFDFERLADGITAFRREFRGTLSLQTMLLSVNAPQIGRLAPLIARTGADEVHLSLPSRPVPKRWEVGLRGEHRSFDAERAFRVLSPAEVLGARETLAGLVGVPVLIPPAFAK